MSSTPAPATLFAPSHRKRSDDERFKLTPKQYLGEERPMEAMNKYFNSVLQGNHVLLREFEFVNATPRNRISLVRNLLETYRANPQDWEISVEDHYQLVSLLCPDFPPTFHDEAKLYMTPNANGTYHYGTITKYFQVLFMFAEFAAAVKRLFDASNAEDKSLPRVNVLWAIRNIVNTKYWDFSCPAASLVDSVLPAPTNGGEAGQEATVTFAQFLLGMTRCEGVLIAPLPLSRQGSSAK